MTEKVITIEECDELTDAVLQGAVRLIECMNEAYEDPEAYCVAVNGFAASLMLNFIARAGGIELDSMSEVERGAAKGGATMVFRHVLAALDSFPVRNKSQEH